METLAKQIETVNNNDYCGETVVTRVLSKLDAERGEKRQFEGVLDGLNDSDIHNLCIEICSHERFCKFRG